RSDPAPVHRIRDLVEDDQPECAGSDLFLGDPPRLASDGLSPLHVVRVPREAFADRPPFDAEPYRGVALSDLPATGLDELHDADLPPPRNSSQHGAEGRGRLPLALTGVDDHDRLGRAGGSRRRDSRWRFRFHLRTGTTACPDPFKSTTLTLAP